MYTAAQWNYNVEAIPESPSDEREYPRLVEDWQRTSPLFAALQKNVMREFRNHHCRSAESDLRNHNITLNESFERAAKACPSIAIHSEIMGGSPCVEGTRIPVYMVLDAVAYHGSVEGVRESYPRLDAQQVIDAILFAKYTIECPIEYEDKTTP